MERYYSIHDIVTFKVVDKVSRRLENVLKDIPTYLLEVPLHYDRQTFEEITRYLKRIEDKVI